MMRAEATNDLLGLYKTCAVFYGMGMAFWLSVSLYHSVTGNWRETKVEYVTALLTDRWSV